MKDGTDDSLQAYSPSVEYISMSSLNAAYMRSSSFSVASVDPFGATEHTLGALSSSESSVGVKLGGLRSSAPTELDVPDVLMTDGSRISVARLASTARTRCVLVFVPRDAVELAALVYAKVASLLHDTGARLVFVSPWTPPQASTFLSRFERVSPFPGVLVCDPDAALFAHYSLTRSKLGAVLSSSRRGPKGLRQALANVSYRAQNRDIASTRVPSARLRCGAVVLRQPSHMELMDLSHSSFGSVASPLAVYKTQETSSSGVACHLDVLAVCGVHGAFVPDIDPAHLYKRFNNMRITSIKARQADEKECRQQLRYRTSKVTPPPRTRTSRQRTWHG